MYNGRKKSSSLSDFYMEHTAKSQNFEQLSEFQTLTADIAVFLITCNTLTFLVFSWLSNSNMQQRVGIN